MAFFGRGAWLVVFRILALSAPPSLAASGLTFSSIAITAGRLVITGTAIAPNVTVSIVGTAFTAKSNAQRNFGFNLNYRTPDCRLTLATSGGTLPLLIGNCGPAGLFPRGAWVTTTAYGLNDLVTFGGQSYRAKTANSAKRPDLFPPIWELLAGRGPQGLTGAEGPQGGQ